MKDICFGIENTWIWFSVSNITEAAYRTSNIVINKCIITLGLRTFTVCCMVWKLVIILHISLFELHLNMNHLWIYNKLYFKFWHIFFIFLFDILTSYFLSFMHLSLYIIVCLSKVCRQDKCTDFNVCDRIIVLGTREGCS